MKNLSNKVLKVGDQFKKGDATLILRRIVKGMAIFYRSYNGKRVIFEAVHVGHIKNSPNTYKKIEVIA